jgi:hypothetical protein
MKQLLLGKSTWTSVVGYLLAALMVIDEMIKAGETSYVKIGIAALIAVLGRISADAGKAAPKTMDGPGGPLPPPVKNPPPAE